MTCDLLVLFKQVVFQVSNLQRIEYWGLNVWCFGSWYAVLFSSNSYWFKKIIFVNVPSKIECSLSLSLSSTTNLLFVRAFGLGIILPVLLRVDPFHFSNKNSLNQKITVLSACENSIFLNYSQSPRKKTTSPLFLENLSSSPPIR